MRLLHLHAIVALAALASCRSAPPPSALIAVQPTAPADSPPVPATAPPNTDDEATRAEVGRREAAILTEIAALWPDHSWAGDYRRVEPENWDRFLVAPISGCLAMRPANSGDWAANWGPVSMDGDKLRVAFERPNEGADAFDNWFAVEGESGNLSLRAWDEKGMRRWEIDVPAGGKREVYRVTDEDAAKRKPLPRAFPFAMGNELRRCFISFYEGLGEDLAGVGPCVIPLEPKLAIETQLQSVLVGSRLTGWVLRKQGNNLRLTLRLEDPRTQQVAGKVDVDVLDGSPICLVAAVRPDQLGDKKFRDFVLLQVNDVDLVPILRERIFVGVRGRLPESSGWEQGLFNHCDASGDSALLGTWSWNGADSDFVAALQLQPYCTPGLIGVSGWYHTPLVNWPHPLWALFYEARAK